MVDSVLSMVINAEVTKIQKTAPCLQGAPSLDGENKTLTAIKHNSVMGAVPEVSAGRSYPGVTEGPLWLRMKQGGREQGQWQQNGGWRDLGL